MIKNQTSLDLREVPLRLLAVCGSPRNKSNSGKVLEKAVEGALEAGNVEVEYYHFNKKKIEACTACSAYCKKNKDCVYKDGFQEFAEKWCRAEAVIWAVPVYTMAGPGLTRALMDRLGQVFFSNRFEEVRQGKPLPRLLKASGVIAQGSSRWGTQEIVLEGMNEHFVLMDCVPVCGDMPHSHIGVAGHIPDKTEPTDDEGLFTDSRILGRRVAETGKILKIGRLAIAGSLGDEYFCSPDSFAQTMRPEVV